MATLNFESEKARHEFIALKSRIQRAFNAFNDLGIQEFRQEIKSCFARAFEIAGTKQWSNPEHQCFEPPLYEEREAKRRRSQSNFLVCYDASFIQDFLSTIDWRRLSIDCNATVKRSEAKSIQQTKPKTNASALGEMLLILEGRSWDPSDLYTPVDSTMRAAATSIVTVLYKVVTSAVIDDGPSKSLLRDTISSIIDRKTHV